MKLKRSKISGRAASYHCISRVVGAQMLFGNREKEMLRKMIRQLADFCGVHVLTYCVMSNHFHVLIEVPERQVVDDAELLRRYEVLYPKPTKFQAATIQVVAAQLASNNAEAVELRARLLARMGDISEYMKALKQRFSVWYNRNHQRQGTLWSDRFKSVLVEGHGNPLQTMAAYIDLNPVRAGLVEDPKDYRFCGYSEAVAATALNSGRSTSNVDGGLSEEVKPVRMARAGLGLLRVWADRLPAGQGTVARAVVMHRLLIFGKGSSPWTHKGKLISREQAVKVLEEQQGELSKAALLRCRVRYFTDGAILGSAEFVYGFTDVWQRERGRKHAPKVNLLRGGAWGDLAVIQGLRKQVFT
jgi:putative transposase